MSYAGSQFSKRAQLVRTRGAFLGQFALSDVAHENHDAGNAAIVPQRRRVRIHATDAAVSTNCPQFKLLLFATKRVPHRSPRFIPRFSADDHVEFLTEQD